MKKLLVSVIAAVILIPSLVFGQNRAVKFKDLPTPASTYDGQSYWCPDCNQAAVCAGSGSGSFAIAISGVWACNKSGGTGTNNSGLIVNGGIAQIGGTGVAALSNNAVASAPTIVSGFTSGTTNYYWCDPQDIAGGNGNISSTSTGTTGQVGTMSCGPQIGAVQWVLLRTATNVQPNQVAANTKIGTCTAVSGSTCMVADSNLTATTFSWVIAPSLSITVPYSKNIYGSVSNWSVAGMQFNNTGDLATQVIPGGNGPMDIFFPAYIGNQDNYWAWLIAGSSGNGQWYAGVGDEGSGFWSVFELTDSPSSLWMSSTGPHNALYGLWNGSPAHGNNGATHPSLVIAGDSNNDAVAPLIFGDGAKGLSGTSPNIIPVWNTSGLGQLGEFDKNGNLVLAHSLIQGATLSDPLTSTGALPPGANFDLQCAQSATTTGPTSGNQFLWNAIYQPLPWSIPNGQIAYYGGTADAVAESEVGIYSIITGGAATLVASSGLIAIATTNQNPALGGGASNLMLNSACVASTNPAPCCTGSGTGTCTNTSQPTATTVFPPGYYAKAISSVATTAKLRICAGEVSYSHGASGSAPSGFLPATATMTLSAPNNAVNPIQLAPY